MVFSLQWIFCDPLGILKRHVHVASSYQRHNLGQDLKEKQHTSKEPRRSCSKAQTLLCGEATIKSHSNDALPSSLTQFQN